MIQTFIKPLDVERDVFLDQIETKLGAKLKMVSDDIITNGFFSTYENEGYLYVDVELYEKDEAPNYTDSIYNNVPFNRGHKSDIRKISGNLKQKLQDTHNKLSYGERVIEKRIK